MKEGPCILDYVQIDRPVMQNGFRMPCNAQKFLVRMRLGL